VHLVPVTSVKTWAHSSAFVLAGRLHQVIDVGPLEQPLHRGLGVCCAPQANFCGACVQHRIKPRGRAVHVVGPHKLLCQLARQELHAGAVARCLAVCHDWLQRVHRVHVPSKCSVVRRKHGACQLGSDRLFFCTRAASTMFLVAARGLVFVFHVLQSSVCGRPRWRTVLGRIAARGASRHTTRGDAFAQLLRGASAGSAVAAFRALATAAAARHCAL
jgi:hypothetical protein